MNTTSERNYLPTLILFIYFVFIMIYLVFYFFFVFYCAYYNLMCIECVKFIKHIFIEDRKPLHSQKKENIINNSVLLTQRPGL